MHYFYILPLSDLIPGPQAKSGPALQRDTIHIKTVGLHTLKWNWNKTASKQLWNCFVSVSFQCVDSL